MVIEASRARLRHGLQQWPGRLVVLVALTLCIGLAGCANHSGEESGSTPTAGSDAAFPVTIDSTVGKATITERPERVVAIGWGSQDVALALGVVPVAMQDMTGDTGDDTGILPWDAPKLNGAKPVLLKYTTDEVPFEEIAGQRPDVILAVNSGLTEEQHAKLSQIAPTVGYPGKAWLTSWQDQLQIVGQALGKTTEASALEKSTNKLIAEAKAAHPEFAGKTIAFGSGTTTTSYNLYLSTD